MISPERADAPDAPAWDLTTFYTGPDGSDFQAAVEGARTAILRCVAALEQTRTALQRTRQAGHAVRTYMTRDVWRDICQLLEAALNRERLVSLYASAVYWEDLSDPARAAMHASVHERIGGLHEMTTLFQSVLSALEPDCLEDCDAVLAYKLSRLRDMGMRLRQDTNRLLIQDLDDPARRGWVRTYNWVQDVMRQWAEDPVPGAAPSTAPAPGLLAVASECLNAVKKTSLITSALGGWESPLAESLERNDVAEEEFRALTEAVRLSFPDVLRFYRITEQFLDGSGPFSLPSALKGELWSTEINWSNACQILHDVIQEHIPSAGPLLWRALDEKWIHARPAPGKRRLAACLPMTSGQSRILVNFGNDTIGLLNLAHEFGHAFHYDKLAPFPELCQQTPFPIAELASMSFEVLLGSSDIPGQDQQVSFSISGVFLASAARALAETYLRFEWERRLYEQRSQSFVSPKALSHLLAEVQADIYGESEMLNTWPTERWVENSHFFTGSYSNWQYFYGLLAALAMLERSRQERAGWWDQHLPRVLEKSGQAAPAAILKDAGINTKSVESWIQGVTAFGRLVDQFERQAHSHSVTPQTSAG